jgi:hypothetical protein
MAKGTKKRSANRAKAKRRHAPERHPAPSGLVEAPKDIGALGPPPGLRETLKDIGERVQRFRDGLPPELRETLKDIGERQQRLPPGLRETLKDIGEQVQRFRDSLRPVTAIDYAPFDRAITGGVSNISKKAAPQISAELTAEASPASLSDPKKQSRRKAVYHGAQSTRAKVVLKRMSPSGEYPTRSELPNADLWDQFCKEYERVEGKAKSSRLGIPSRSTVLRVVGRKER